MSRRKDEVRNFRKERISAPEAAAFLKVSERSFFRLVESGIIPKSDDGKYILGEVVDAYYQNRSSPKNLKAEQTRLTAAQADLKELELAEQRGELHRASAVAKVWTDNIANAKSRLLAIPAKVSPKVIGKDLNETQAIIKGAVYEALKELADYDSGRITRTAATLRQ